MKRKLPLALRPLVDGYRWRRTTIGESGADIYQLNRKGRPSLFLKKSRTTPYMSLQDEAARLRWLGGKLDVPTVLEVVADGEEEWLLMTALTGTNAAEASTPPHIIVRVLADALKKLHAIAVEACPFDESLERKIARAAENVAAGLVEESHFDERNLGRSAESLFAEMLRKRPSVEELVVTHGDACLPNFMLNEDRFSGLVDCARVGRADRYQDLALACRSLEYNFGEEWIEPFLARYGLSRVDADRLAFYRLLDEFS